MTHAQLIEMLKKFMDHYLVVNTDVQTLMGELPSTDLISIMYSQAFSDLKASNASVKVLLDLLTTQEN